MKPKEPKESLLIGVFIFPKKYMDYTGYIDTHCFIFQVEVYIVGKNVDIPFINTQVI